MTTSTLEELSYLRSLPEYMSGGAPNGLATRRQLRALGLSAAGLRPAARLHYCVYHYYCYLYRVADARPVRPLTERQRQALADGRKLAFTRPCKRCGQVRVDIRDGRRLCDPCMVIVEAARERRRQEEAEKFARMLADDHAAASRWAAEVLADPATAVLDTETTGLGEDYIVEIALLDNAGRTLLDTLVNPRVPIPAEASAIHGIEDQEAAGAPSFADLWPELRELLTARRVIIYNKEYDTGILLIEADRYFRATAPEVPVRDWDRHPAAVEWIASVRAECAMQRYAEWFGAWSDYWGDYQWQRLNGGHRAAGDCRAVLRLLHTMAGDPLPATSQSATSAALSDGERRSGSAATDLM